MRTEQPTKLNVMANAIVMLWFVLLLVLVSVSVSVFGIDYLLYVQIILGSVKVAEWSSFGK